MAKFLIKANDEVLSHCSCVSPLAAGSSQLDCPWCGCGWLICCQDCGKAFTYARVVQTDLSYDQIVRRDFSRRGYDLTEAQISDIANWLADAMAPFELDEIVVYLDGAYFAVKQRDINFTGFFARHQMDQLPHALALDDPAILLEKLGNKSYWFDRERPDRNGDE